MASELLGWALAINVVLFIRLMWNAPYYFKHITEYESINADVKMIYAQIDLEKHRLMMKEAQDADRPAGSAD